MSNINRTNAEPVVLVMSVLAGLQILFAGAGLGDIIGVKAVFLGMLLVGAIQGGIQFWVRGQVVAVANVVEYVDSAGEVATGLAADPVGELPDTGTPIYDELDNERGAYETSSLLMALACIVVIAVGLVWLVRAF